jgi:putative sterol carrier protein
VNTFEQLKAKLAEKAASVDPFNKIIKIELDGNVLVLNGNTSPPSVEDDADSPDITVSSSVEVFSDMLDKKINPQLAIMTRKIKIKGDILAAMPLMDML